MSATWHDSRLPRALTAATLSVALMISPSSTSQTSEYGDEEDVGASRSASVADVDHMWTWILAGLTGAAAITGAALLGVAHSRQDSLISDLAQTDTSGAVVGVNQVDAERIDQDNHDLQTGAFVAFGVAASAAIGTLVVGLTRSASGGDGDRYEDDEPYEVRAVPEFFGAPVAGGGLVGATWTF